MGSGTEFDVLVLEGRFGVANYGRDTRFRLSRGMSLFACAASYICNFSFRKSFQVQKCPLIVVDASHD